MLVNYNVLQFSIYKPPEYLQYVLCSLTIIVMLGLYCTFYK